MQFTRSMLGAAAASGIMLTSTVVLASGPRSTEIHVPGSDVTVRLFDAPDMTGSITPHYAVRFGRGDFSAPRATSYEIMLRHERFDPLVADAIPVVAPELAADTDTNLYIVQFVTQSLEAYRTALSDLGADVTWVLPRHSHIVRMTPDVRDAVADLPFVRWVGDYQPAYRLEAELIDAIVVGAPSESALTCNVMVLDSSAETKAEVADAIKDAGGAVELEDAGKYLMRATLTPMQIAQLARHDRVLFIDRWGALEADMNISRELSGANYVETVAGFTGEGVRGEVYDLGFNTSHGDFASRPLIIHDNAGSDSHGAATSGIVFGDGTGNPAARGILPSGQGIVARSDTLGQASRYQHTGELLEAPYYGVFQTSSVGSPRTFFYTTISADTDAALFDFDVLHCQSQSNAGNQDSRPQAWAKNILSGGGVRHYDTLDTSDDCWCNGASVGPASDGRIKPDLCHFYDDTLTTTTGGPAAYTTSFGGTSGATPNICGYTGLFFQMWSEGVFGNEVDPGQSVFDNRCHMTTAKAVMINTATQYAFSGEGHDLTRVHQGWGRPDVAKLWDLREKLFIVDETDVIGNLESRAYVLAVAPGEAEFKATLVFADPPGNPAAGEQRVNDVTLKVTAPDGTVYWGNHGLRGNNYSLAGGAPNTVDTVENVFVQDPQAGAWVVEIFADEIVEDGHVETPELDVDYALVVSAVNPVSDTGVARLNRAQYQCDDSAGITVTDAGLNLDAGVIEMTMVEIASDSQPAGMSVMLTETTADSGTFTGTVALNTAGGGGALQVTAGDTVTITYIDADDGQGNFNVVVTDSATVDCTAPMISNVQIASVGPFDAWITFETDEDTRGSVTFGSSCGSLTETVTQPGFGTFHEIHLVGLNEATTYFFEVAAEDQAGNSVTDNAGGACFSFTTTDIPLYFTEEFSAFDLDDMTLMLTPAPIVDGYVVCIEPAAGLPTDPAGGSSLPLSDDDSEFVSASTPVWLYGTSYNGFYVGSNGYITFDSGDTDYTESLGDHFDQVRISALFDDLNPNSGGTVSAKTLADRIAVTWEDVPEYSSTGSNTFQVELFFDGRIHLTWAGVTSSDSIVGLSEGLGIPPSFVAIDLSGMGGCAAPCPTDVTGDGVTGFDDVLVVLSNWGLDPMTNDGDVNDDGAIDFSDLVSILSGWGPCS